MTGWLLDLPVLHHKQKGRNARLIRTVIFCLVAVATIYISLADFFFPFPTMAYTGALIIFVVALISVWLLKKEKVKTASYFIVISMWLMLVTINVFVGGTQNMHIVNYFPVLLLTAMLLGGKAGVIMAAVTIASTLGVAMGQQNGYLLQITQATTPFVGWLTLTVNLSLNALLLYLGMKNLTDALKKAQREIEERKQVEVQLRESEERFKVIADATPIPIVVTNKNDSQILYANKIMLKAMGKNLDDIGQLMAANYYYYNADRERILNEVKSNGMLRSTEVLFKSPTGQPTWVVLSIRPVKFQGQEALLSGFYNINKIKETEKQNQKLLAEMEQKNRELEMKNAELERFTYTVSHDLKSPIVTIKGFLGFLKLDVAAGDTKKINNDIYNIEKATDTMQQLLEELLELSRIGRIVNPPEPVSLTELAAAVQQTLSGTLNSRNIALHIQPNMPIILGDKTRLHEVLQNLIENAAKFMGNQPAPQIAVGATQNNDVVTCYVKDNGIGIPKRYHETVFGLFDRLNKQIEGTGIGLALARRIVEVHNGQIWVMSDGVANQGSTFYFTLCTHQQQVAPPTTTLGTAK